MSAQVAVIMPLYNKRAFIRRAVESVLGQTHADFRLIVVDDGSTDGSADEVERMRDLRISLIRAQHRGPGAARNIGMRSSTADWIGLLDADDEWHPTFLEKTCTAARRAPEVAAVFSDIHVRNCPARTGVPLAGLIEDYHRARLRYRVAMTSSSVLLSRKRFLSMGAFREGYRYAEDTEAWFRLTCEAPVYYIPEALCAIELNDPAATTATANSRERAHGLERLLESYDAYCRTERIPQPQARSCRRFMQHQRGRLAAHLIKAGCVAAGVRVLLTGVPPGQHTWREYVYCARLLSKHVVKAADR